MELTTGTFVLLCLVSLPILVTLLRPKTTPSSKKRRPPGPWNLPLVGGLLHLLKSHPHIALRDLANKYGPVMFLRIGQIDTVVISSPGAAQQVLQEKDLTFASRPSIPNLEIFCYGNVDVALAPYGAYWRMLRKLCTMELLSGKMVRKLAPVRNYETLSLIRKIHVGSKCKEPVNLGKLLVSCANAITSKAAFGQVCSGELQDQFLSAIEVAIKISGGMSFGDLFPSMQFVDVITGVRRRSWQARWQLDVVFDKIIAQCDAQRGDDLVSVLLRIRDKGELEFPFDTTNIKAIIADMFTAGTETTSSVAEWVMLELMKNPDVMAKAQDEVRRVFGNKSAQDHENLIDELPYLKIVIKEGMRLHPVVPLLIPRLCRETCDIGGFEVVEGTRVMVNTWAMARNPEHWHDGEKFWPERFEDGKTDYKASRFDYLPFGAGRRRCPGDNFGLAVLELIVARLLYYFDWSLPDGIHPDEINMDVVFGVTMRRKYQLHLVASPHTVIP
ncbi:hypothetical protein PR202_ga27695 [Eleusine coracana subsp. coracana]|uniref:Uncharacterized protein n=1 Tax=Eleusine coracana subsp. coracana TaxID=191504 RepID=A0AAV5DIA4_ELECO|nr:hypothetical protein QOZ80_8AG0623390 [Eleusine coracana subsp. coracana]GJN09670.1 hypothetical protein PR202_ga27695 [Eleusine coracana subsp. coracana]